MAIEEPSYTVAFKEGTLEIRDYPALIAAEVIVSGERNEAVKTGFRLLAAYIFGGNVGQQSIAMTAPVMQTGFVGESISMSVPVTQTMSGEGNWIIRFMMPREYSFETLPKPNDQRVCLVNLPALRVAVIRFSGLAKEPDVEQKTDKLNAFISFHGLHITGAVTLARYNPPWTLWFMRRNEIMIPVKVEAAQ
jgi:SOUL heme-binding protein